MNDYFAVDPYDHVLLREGITERIGAAPEGHWYALIDRAFDHGGKPFSASPVSDYPVYHTGRLQALATVSPSLIELPTESQAQLRKFLGRLLLHCRGRPMLSFIQSEHSGNELVEAWQELLEVETADGQAFLLRFADIRVLPELNDCVTPLWQRLAHVVTAWWIINRSGELAALPLVKAQGESGKFRINEREFACLLASGLPDALADRLHEHFPDLLAKRSGSANFRLLHRGCKLAGRHGIEAYPAQLALSVAFLYSDGKLLDDPQFESWMQQKPWLNGSLEAALGDYLETMEATP